MSLDPKTAIIVQISAAVAANTLPALRFGINDALNLGLSKEEIDEIIKLAREIQQQPISHAEHLAHQLLREPGKKKIHDHHYTDGHCSC